MASVRVTLGLSSADVMSTAVGINVATTLSADSGSIARAKVKGTAADTDDLVVYKANDKLENAYLYIQNLDQEKENYITVRNETESNTALVAKIGGGEFAFIPVAVDKTYQCIATKVNTLIEYGVFGLDNSAVTLA
jgi:precorrin-2 methylase